MNYVVEGTPEECSEKADAYFALHWPYGGAYHRNNNSLSLMRQEPHSEARGCLTALFTLGIRGWEAPEISTAHVSFVRDGERTVATLEASRPDFADALQTWVVEELGARPV